LCWLFGRQPPLPENESRSAAHSSNLVDSLGLVVSINSCFLCMAVKDSPRRAAPWTFVLRCKKFKIRNHAKFESPVGTQEQWLRLFLNERQLSSTYLPKIDNFQCARIETFDSF